MHVLGSIFGSAVPLWGWGVPVSSEKPQMTVAEYAAHRGCSDSYVRRMRREQRLVMGEGKLIDVAASDAKLDAETDPLRGGNRSAQEIDEAIDAAYAAVITPAGGVGLKEAVRRERLARARLAELDLGEQAKQLVRVKEIDRHVFTLARQTLERLRSISSRLRTSLAAESDPRVCESLLDAEIAKVCEEFQRFAAAMAAARSTPDQAEAA